MYYIYPFLEASRYLYYKATTNDSFTNIFQPTLPKTSTVVEPFSFDNKYPCKDDIINQLVTMNVEEKNEVRKIPFHKHVC